MKPTAHPSLLYVTLLRCFRAAVWLALLAGVVACACHVYDVAVKYA